MPICQAPARSWTASFVCSAFMSRAYTGLRALSLGRDFFRGLLLAADHALGEFAGQLGEVIECPFERADTHRRGAQLDDQVVHLRLRQVRRHLVPALPV